jgi:large subunit ribosomal protein L10
LLLTEEDVFIEKTLGGGTVSTKAIERKIAQVDALAIKMKEASSVVIADYQGLSVDQVTKLRTALFENDCEFRVIKNNIIRRAAEQAGYAKLLESVTGPNAVAFSYEDSVSAAKVIHDFSEENEQLELKVGIVDEDYMDNTRINKIATIPTREELLTMLAGGLIQPIRNVAIAINMHKENLEQQNG